jgi:hypothetical protein
MELNEMLRRLDGMVGRAIQALGDDAAPRGPAAGTAPAAGGSGVAADQILGSVEHFLACGVDLKRWWDAAWAGQSFAQRFALGRTFNEPARSFGFFDQAPVAGALTPIMGNYQEMFFDQPKAPRAGRPDSARWMREQIREFVLHYFMRVSAFRPPDAYVAGGGPPPPIGAFSPEQRFAIVDLRDLGRLYEWIVLRVQIFDFNLNVQPLGDSGPQLSLPLAEASYLVLAPGFVCEQDDPAAGILGRYGFGYSFIKNPTSGFLSYGPGEFEAALELIQWTVGSSGETTVSMAFVANRPQRITNLTLDPVALGLRLAEWGTLGLAAPLLAPLRELTAGRFRLHLDPAFGFVDLANLATLGLAARELCWSREQLEKDFLAKHFLQHYQAIAGSLLSWRLVCDWLDAAAVPERIVEGRSG